LKKNSKTYLAFKNTYAFWFLLSYLILVLASCSKTKPSKPNVIFILVDDLGWTDLSSYGSTFYQTPNIDSLAYNGAQLKNAYAACHVCSPTRASILTGKYPATLHLTDYIPGKTNPDSKYSPPVWKKCLDTNEITIANIFKANNYKTAHVGKWHLGKDPIYWPEHQGFDLNIGGWSAGQPLKNKKKGYNGYFSPFGNPRIQHRKNGEYLTTRLTDEAITFIRQNQDTPFFLNLWYYSVHTPLQAEQDKFQKYEKIKDDSNNHNNPVYAAMLEQLDVQIGKLMKTLRDLNLEENTLIVFTSDNGGLVGNHKRFKENITSNYPLRSGKGDMYEGGVRVPGIIYFPKKIKSKKIATPIISIDYLPTLIDFLDLKITAASTFEGRSFSALLQGDADLKSRPLYWHYPHYHTEGAVPYSAILYNDFKLIHNLENDSLELYNLKKDIGEQENLAHSNTAMTKKLFNMLNDWKQGVKAQNPLINSN